MNLSRKNKKNVNKKSSKKLTTKPKKKLSKKSIIKSRKKITRKLRKKYNKNKLKFNKINGGTRRPRISSMLSQIINRTRHSDGPVIGSRVPQAVGIPAAIVADIREDERLLNEALRQVIMYVEETVTEMGSVNNILINDPMPNQTKLVTHLFKANIAFDNAWDVEQPIRTLLNRVIENQLVLNNHAHDASVAADKAHDALIIQNDRMLEADLIIRDFFDNSSELGETWLWKLEQSKRMTKLAVKAADNTRIMLQKLIETVNKMIARQRQPTRVWGGPSIAMGVPASQQ